jgi:hypothetical protein
MINQYSQVNAQCDMQGIPAPDIRREQLEQFIDEHIDAYVMFVAEASSGKGARYTGIPMTDERSLGGFRRHLGIEPAAILSTPFRRTSAVTAETGEKGALELTAGVMWGTLRALGIEPKRILLANAVPFHPIGNSCYSNRPVSGHEVRACLPLLEEMVSLAPKALLVPVGRVAEQALDMLGYAHLPYVRHPANRGIGQFRAGVENVKKIAKL